MVAQRVERWTCDQQVVGSNPIRGKGRLDKFWKNYKYTADQKIFMGRRQVISQEVQLA